MILNIENVISKIQKESHQGTKRWNVPTILVICPDTYNVVDINKALAGKYNRSDSIDQYDVHVHKLFAKHIKPEE